MKNLIFPIFALLTIVGCSARPYAVDLIQPDQKSNLTVGVIKSQLVKGKTTQAEILELFGAPNLVTTNSDGNEVWNYSRSSMQTGADARGYSSFWGDQAGQSVISTASTASMDLIITFDKNDIIQNYKVISSSF